jgi:hypothetical protein
MMYKLGTKGVKVDNHKVFLIHAPADDKAAMDANAGKIPVDVKAIMEKYGSAEDTELTAEVTSEKREYNFDLK